MAQIKLLYLMQNHQSFTNFQIKFKFQITEILQKGILPVENTYMLWYTVIIQVVVFGNGVHCMEISIFALAAALALGILLAGRFSVASVLVFYAVYILIHILLRKRAILHIILAGVFVLGVILLQYHTSIHNRDLYPYLNKYVELTGRVASIPKQTDDNMRYIVDVRVVNMSGEHKQIKENILLSTKLRLKYGQTVTFSGFVSEFPSKMNENGFDFNRYYKSKDVFFKCYSNRVAKSDTQLSSYSLYSLSTSVKNSITQILENYTQGDRKELLKAILVGEGSCFSEDFDRVLSRTGTKRFFYPAYLHIFFILLLIGTLQKIISKKSRDILTVLVLLFYAGCQSSHPVIVKACLLYCIMIAFSNYFGFIHFIDAVGALVIAVGILNPLLIYNDCFVMSVAASILVNWFYPYSKQIIERLKTKRLGFIIFRHRFIERLLSVGVICTFGLLPLTAYYCNGFSIYSILTAVIFIPATIIIIAVSIPTIIWIAIFKSVPFFASLVSYGTVVYMKLPYLVAKLPLSYISLPTPRILTVLTVYLFVYILWRYLGGERGKRIQILTVISVGLLSVAIMGQAARIGTMEITFVNVGQGDGAFVEMPFRDVVLIDGGGGTEYNKSYNPGKSIYVPYLEQRGITKIDCAIVSHMHKDHVQGIIEAVKNLQVKDVYIPKSLPGNEYTKELTSEAKKNNTRVHIVEEDTRLTFKSGLVIEIIVPKGSVRLSADENDTSLMARVEYGKASCLFTGDMTALSEHNMLLYGKVEKSDILKVAHHGSNSASTDEFIEAVSPDIAVISVGEDNEHGLPSKEVLKRLDGIRLYRTDLNGDIRIVSDKNKIRWVNTYK